MSTEKPIILGLQSKQIGDIGQGAGAVFGIACTIVKLVAAWIKANKQIPEEVQRLNTIAATIQTIHTKISKQTDQLGAILDAIGALLRTSLDLLESFEEKKVSCFCFCFFFKQTHSHTKKIESTVEEVVLQPKEPPPKVKELE